VAAPAFIRRAALPDWNARSAPVPRRAKFRVIPVKTGIFAIGQKKRRFGTENCEADQSLARQFPLPAKREFIRA
jgi:hypothetical protein